jgi:hypothetical protein
MMTDAQIRQYMTTPEFERRCLELHARLDAGGNPTNAEIAELLDLPVSFIDRLIDRWTRHEVLPEIRRTGSYCGQMLDGMVRQATKLFGP